MQQLRGDEFRRAGAEVAGLPQRYRTLESSLPRANGTTRELGTDIERMLSELGY